MTSKSFSNWHKCPVCNGRIVLSWTFDGDKALHVAECENAEKNRCSYKRRTMFKVIDFD